MSRKQEKSFVDHAKQIMDENIHLARFNDTQRNIEKLKAHYIQLTQENKNLKTDNDRLKELFLLIHENNSALHDQIIFLEEIINSLKVLISIKDLNRKNLLWYNQNYNRILGYRHKELQELNCDKTLNLYHPDDRHKIEDRDRYMSDSTNNRHSCTIRMRHKNGSWVKMNSDFIALKRNPDGSLSKAMEILTNVQ
jgi:PAS domain S-box-containing protein